ncbi:MAG: multicopper oxidase domain-containing protein, partial [Acidobacteriaceae bacterium]|nr:multicopper oxidase domain-containing protein [Acidobacteriaceae bacterium]
MASRHVSTAWCLPVLILVAAISASAQSFRVQCPTSTITHPDPTNTGVNNAEPAYNGPTTFTQAASGMYLVPSGNVNGAIKCQQISGGDGYATMADGTQTFMFSFGPLSGLADIANGLPGTEFPNVFNQMYPSSSTAAASGMPLRPGDPATTDGSHDAGAWAQGAWDETKGAPFTWNGAVGLTTEVTNIVNITQISESGNTVTAMTDMPLGLPVGAQVNIARVTEAGYNGQFTITGLGTGTNSTGGQSPTFSYTDPVTGIAADAGPTGGFASSLPVEDGHVDPRQIMDVGVMNGNIPAPLIAIDEDDEFFLTLTNVGMIMRPDLFEQHTVHFHGYPNASSFYDGVPDASVAINIGGSFTYYYLAPDAGTYFWHCHITPPEHLQMGMVGQLYVRPRQNRVPSGTTVYSALQAQQSDLRTACNPSA